VVEALRAHDLLERTLLSTMFMRSLVRVRELEPSLRLGWSVPRMRRDPTDSRALTAAAYGGLLYLRRRVRRAAERHLAAGRCDAVMAHWKLVTPALVRTVRAAGGELYVWTVDDAGQIRRLERLGVTGVITNDPRLFV
jgi:glycerophosphoryl diester phosphodiesterase